MTMFRRNFVKAALATVLAAPLMALGAGPEAGRIEYSGADTMQAFEAKLAEVSRNKVTANVFHATWCGPCKTLFGQFATMQKDQSVQVNVLAVDIEKYPNVTAGSLPFKATPQTRIYADGDEQHYFAGYLKDGGEADMARYIRDLNNALKGGPTQVMAPRF